MSAPSEYNFNEILKNVALKCDLTDWRYSLDKFESIGQNYFGVLVPLHFIGTNRTGIEIKVSLVLKLAPTDKRYRVSGAITRMFNRETFMYKVVLDKYQEIQKKIPTTQYVIPKCYYICQKYCEEVIAMQDMREHGYKPYSNGSFLDLDHIVVSIKSLAKFHALSFLLKHTDEKLYDEIEQECVPLNDATDKRFMEVINDRLLKALDKFANTKYVTLLANLQENYVKFIKEAAETEVTCICHGDIWKENILFKYEDSKPVEACLIDYQTSRTCSPAYDILYLITSSTDSNLRQLHFGQLLDNYYETFDNFIKTAGLDTRDIYSRKMFDDDLKTVAPACFIVANTALWLSSGLQQEGHVRSKQIFTTHTEKANAEQKYKTIVKSIIDDYSTYGIPI